MGKNAISSSYNYNIGCIVFPIPYISGSQIGGSRPSRRMESKAFLFKEGVALLPWQGWCHSDHDAFAAKGLASYL